MIVLNRKTRLCVSAMLIALTVSAPASAEVTVPRTPAGRVLSAMLAAWNSGDRARIAAYVKRYQANDPHGTDVLIDHILDVRRETGGFELVSIEHSAPLSIEYVINARSTPQTWFTSLEVTDEKSPRVVEMHRDEIPRGSKVPAVRIVVDAAMRARVVDGVTRLLTDWYVYPDVAKDMVASLRAHQAMAEYDAITDGRKLARVINDQLHDINPDGHLSVECTPETITDEWAEPPALDTEPPVDNRFRADLLRDNGGVERVDRLDGNVGYLKVNFFGPLSVCGPTVSAAMNVLAHVETLIVDVRDNSGGAPRMVAWLSSYLFDARTHLNDVYERKRNRTIEFWTRADVPGPKLGGKARVYVLTSRRTFSGGEELAYDLKYLKRATLVGENTGGGAHPTAPLRVDDHFVIHVPYVRAVNPVTKTNWEGTGVAPNVEAPAEQVLDVAKRLAAEGRNAPPTPPAAAP